MKIEILEQKKNPLLKRVEASVSLEHPGKATPSRREILPELARALKSREELLIIDKIFSVPGRGVSRARVLAYGKREEIPKEKIEKMKKRMPEKKGAAAPAEGGPEGKKPGESPQKEEPKPEEKKEAPKGEKPAETPKGEGPEKPEGDTS